ncbi:flavin reductase family protein [Flavobacterium sp. CYK-55]|uniref:flavin reductase family protein n=1 Tax=Flavobacterium sp. CYK-55 TaxID=2835529 RepID=UPI001BCC5C89|nr:flavin reductase family protein [Flavobacterium sp. CYK-55]MBS7786843.1 flavin reductase family protein [Flavobacterium sp. CYK-55]
MQFDPNHLEQSAIYKLLTGLIIPRPIGWISSVDANGVVNLAPFSYFNAVGDDPPHVMFSTSRSNHIIKDTLHNVLQTKQFVVNMVTEELAEAMNLTAHPISADESEFDYAHLTPIASVKVAPPRVLESPVSMECELVHHYTLEGSQNGGSTIIIGRIVQFHIAEELLMDGYKINLEHYQPVARLAGSNYAKLGEIFTIKRN